MHPDIKYNYVSILVFHYSPSLRMILIDGSVAQLARYFIRTHNKAAQFYMKRIEIQIRWLNRLVILITFLYPYLSLSFVLISSSSIYLKRLPFLNANSMEIFPRKGFLCAFFKSNRYIFHLPSKHFTYQEDRIKLTLKSMICLTGIGNLSIVAIEESILFHGKVPEHFTFTF